MYMSNYPPIVWDWAGDRLIKQDSYTPAQSLIVDCTITRCVIGRDVKYGRLS